jgi:O-antigen/teichoic acid export membrane protein
VLALLTILANIGAVLLGNGLLALAAISVAAGLVQRFAIWGFIQRHHPELFAVQGTWNSQCAKAMVQPSLYLWVTGLGGFLILGTDSYFIALLRGTQDIPSYRAGYTIVHNLYQLACTFGLSSSVFISQAWQAGELSTIQRITIRNAQLALSIMAAGVAFILVEGRELTDLWLGQGNFVGYEILLIFCIILTLEVQYQTLTLSSRATEDERYAPWAITAGFLNIIFTWYLIKPLGLLGVAIATMLAQMLTNNWYGVYRPMMRLKLNFKVYLRHVIGLWGLVLICCLVCSWSVKQGITLLGVNSEWFIAGVTAAVCGAIFLFFLWVSILEKHHREFIQKRVIRLMRLSMFTL